MDARRSSKLQECLAHCPSNVCCLSFGKRSGRVMATGGEDKLVKLWAVGKPMSIMSLSGHTSSIESTEFNIEEESVAAGSMSGSIRIWDLEQAKIIRALSGHTASVKSMHFHQYGKYVASGSLDTTVKLWEVSRKGCLNTYRGHRGCVHEVKFSPDGKWLVSAGDDGIVKLWCLATGKVLAELTGHTGPVTAVAFHPNVLLLATASVDRTVRIYDLETFTQIACSGIELGPMPVRKLAFHPEGFCLYCATQDFLKVYNHETMECLDTVQVGWRAGGGLVDMAFMPSFDQLVGASVAQSTVSTYVVDIKACMPFASQLARDDTTAKPSRPFTQSSSVSPAPAAIAPVAKGSVPPRKSFCLSAEANKDGPVQEDADSATATEADEPTCLDPVIDDPEECTRVFKTRARVVRSPVRIAPTSKPAPPPFDPKGDTCEFLISIPVAPMTPESKLEEETDVVRRIHQAHESFVQVMNSRLQALTAIRSRWSSKDPRRALEQTVLMKDPAVLVDFLNIMNQNSKLWNLDLVTLTLPTLNGLMQSKYANHVETTCQTLKIILKHFAQLISTTVRAPPSIGIDLYQEERLNKCRECMFHLDEIKSSLDSELIARKAGAIGREAKVMFALLD